MLNISRLLFFVTWDRPLTGVKWQVLAELKSYKQIYLAELLWSMRLDHRHDHFKSYGLKFAANHIYPSIS